jgi:hypothetical protein
MLGAAHSTTQLEAAAASKMLQSVTAADLRRAKKAVSAAGSVRHLQLMMLKAYRTVPQSQK